MERKYTGYFGELQKLIEYGQITKEHPYNDLYEYIIRTNIEKLRKQNIRKTLNEDINRVQGLIEESFNNNCGIIDLEMQPYIIDIYGEVFQKYMHQLKRIKELEDYKEYEILVDDIYTELIENLNENTIKNNQETIAIYDKLLEDCSEILNGIKYKGKYLIDETMTEETLNRTINKDTVKEFINKLSEKDLEAFMMLEQFENKKLKLSKKCIEISTIIENSEDIVFTYLLKKVQEKTKEYEKIIIEKIKDNKKILKKLQLENIIAIINNEYRLNLTTDRLGELKFSGELFEYLNIRCRLKDVETIIKNRIKNETYNSDIKSYIEIPPFEKMEKRKIDETLDIILKKYKKEKFIEYNENSMAIANIESNKELYKTQTIKELEQESDTNILTITMPVAPGMISRRNALYIVRLLIEIEENEEELNGFLQNDICELQSKEQNFIKNITSDKLKEYIDDKKYTIQKQRRIK